MDDLYKAVEGLAVCLRRLLVAGAGPGDERLRAAGLRLASLAPAPPAVAALAAEVALLYTEADARAAAARLCRLAVMVRRVRGALARPNGPTDPAAAPGRPSHLRPGVGEGAARKPRHTYLDDNGDVRREFWP